MRSCSCATTSRRQTVSKKSRAAARSVTARSALATALMMGGFMVRRGRWSSFGLDAPGADDGAIADGVGGCSADELLGGHGLGHLAAGQDEVLGRAGREDAVDLRVDTGEHR